MCPSRWLTPISGAPVARETALAAASPTKSAPISPGPDVTATPSRSSNLIPAWNKASSSSGFRTSTCARDASSGTTPPYLRCTSTWLETRFERIERPSSTTATAVSSQEVSMPRTIMFDRGLRSPLVRATPSSSLRPHVGGHVGDDRFQRSPVLRAGHVVDPHDQGVLSGLLVVALAHADRPEPEPPVHPLGSPVRHPVLERNRPRSQLNSPVEQLVHQAGADLPALVVRVDGDRGDVGLVPVADHAAVTHQVLPALGHEIGPVARLRHLREEQRGGPRPGVDLPLDGHHP